MSGCVETCVRGLFADERAVPELWRKDADERNVVAKTEIGGSRALLLQLRDRQRLEIARIGDRTLGNRTIEIGRAFCADERMCVGSPVWLLRTIADRRWQQVGHRLAQDVF